MIRKYLPFLRAPEGAPATAPAAPATPTAEEVQAKAKQAVESMFGNPPKPAEEPEPPTDPVVKPTAPPATAAPAAPAATTAPEKTEDEKRQELINQTAKATAEAVADRLKPAAAPPAAPAAPTEAPALPEMGAEDKADYEVLLKLGETDPVYAEKAEKYAKFVTASYAYQDAWLAKNPGKEFDANDEEHTAWYEANQQITPEEIQEAKADLKTAQKFEAMAQKRIAPALEKIRQKEIEEEIQKAVPVVAKVITGQVAKLVEMVDPALAAHLKDEKGEVSIGTEAEARVVAADPIAAREIRKAVDQARPMIMELEKTTIPALDYRLKVVPWRDAQGVVQPPVPLHLEIDGFRKKAEADIMAKPEAERVKDGKPFVTVDTYQAELGRIYAANKNNPAKLEQEMQRYSDSVSRITVDEIEAKILEHFSGEAKKVIGEINSAAEMKYRQSTPTATPAARPATPVHAPANNKPKPPSLGAQTPVVTTPAAGAAEQKNMAQQATKQMFG